MDGALVAAMFGLLSAASWGGGDFCGGLTARRAPLMWVLVIGEVGGVVLLVALALAFGEPLPGLAGLAWAAGAGAAGAVGLGMLYSGLSVGRAAVIAPTSAVVAATVPVLVTAWSEGLPQPARLAGFGLALLGIWLVAQSGEQGASLAGLPRALLAGLGFGLFFVLIARSSQDTTFWPLVVARLVPLPVTFSLLTWRNQLGQLPRAALGLALLSAVLDVGGNTFFLLASQAGRLDIAAVLSSLYPASTVVLSRVILGEGMTRTQVAGLLAALAAIVLIVA